MKKRLLALLLIIAMLVSAAPAAFALELPNVGDVSDMDITKVQAVIKTLSDYVNGKLGSTNDPSENPSYEASHGEYEVSSDSYYVSLGDSTVTGMSAANGSNPEGYGNYGYKTMVKECFPYKLAEKLGMNTESQYIQLGMGALRTIDLRYILDDSFTPDGYTMNYLMKRINENAGGIDAMRADYKAALAKADLVTLSIGSNNFGNFVSMQINGMVADIIKSNKELMNLLNGPMGAQIKPMITNIVDLEAEYYELNWDSYLDAEGWAILNDISAEIRVMLVEMGIPEEIDGGEIIQSVLNEQFGVHPITGKPFVTANIDLKIPTYDLAIKAVELYVYGYVSHAFNYSVIVDEFTKSATQRSFF